MLARWIIKNLSTADVASADDEPFLATILKDFRRQIFTNALAAPSLEHRLSKSEEADSRPAECSKSTSHELRKLAEEERDHYKELLWRLYEGVYGHRQAQNIDPFTTAVGGALEVVKAFRERK
jgi:hypothetical protein